MRSAAAPTMAPPMAPIAAPSGPLVRPMAPATTAPAAAAPTVVACVSPLDLTGVCGSSSIPAHLQAACRGLHRALPVRTLRQVVQQLHPLLEDAPSGHRVRPPVD